MHRRITGALVIATHNPGKLAEMRELLAPHGVEAVSAGELGLAEPEETGQTFRANAAIKAIAAAKAAQLPAFADDSGLVVDALDGAPGIYSARWAGEGNDFMAAMSRIERLLQEPGARLRQTGGDLPWLAPNAITRSEPPSASTCTGRSACQSARIAISTATSATRRSTRKDLPVRLRARSKQQRRARRDAPSRRSFSAAARRR